MTQPQDPHKQTQTTSSTQDPNQAKYVRTTPAEVHKDAHKQKNRRRTLIFAGVVGVAVVGIVIALVVFLNNQGLGGGGHKAPYASGQDNVAVIHVEGTIAEANETYNQEWLDQTINNAKLDKNNKGIALLVDSGGGSIYESDATLLALKTYQEETDRPVYTYMEHMAASGGYYIASSSDAIVINRNGLTGSIGVIGIMVPDISGLLEKIGVDMQVAYSGANKLATQGFSPLTDEQKAIFQTMSDEYYQQFVQIVADGRGMTYDQVQALADGRIYTATQAKANGLVDEVVLSYQEFEDYFRDKEGLEEGVAFKEHSYQSPKTFFNSFMETGARLQGLTQDPTTQLIRALEDKAILQPTYIYAS